MDQTSIPALFLPAHLRLGAASWPEYKHAVETVCRVAGVAAHLEPASPSARPPRWSDDEYASDADADEYGWQRDDDLCKAIITLNVKDFPRLAVPAGADVPARAVWAALARLHAPKKRWWHSSLEWRPRPLTALEICLLGLLLLYAYALALTHGELEAQAQEELARVAAEGRRYDFGHYSSGGGGGGKLRF